MCRLCLEGMPQPACRPPEFTVIHEQQTQHLDSSLGGVAVGKSLEQMFSLEQSFVQAEIDNSQASFYGANQHLNVTYLGITGSIGDLSKLCPMDLSQESPEALDRFTAEILIEGGTYTIDEKTLGLVSEEKKEEYKKTVHVRVPPPKYEQSNNASKAEDHGVAQLNKEVNSLKGGKDKNETANSQLSTKEKVVEATKRSVEDRKTSSKSVVAIELVVEHTAQTDPVKTANQQQESEIIAVTPTTLFTEQQHMESIRIKQGDERQLSAEQVVSVATINPNAVQRPLESTPVARMDADNSIVSEVYLQQATSEQLRGDIESGSFVSVPSTDHESEPVEKTPINNSTEPFEIKTIVELSHTTELTVGNSLEEQQPSWSMGEQATVNTEEQSFVNFEQVPYDIELDEPDILEASGIGIDLVDSENHFSSAALDSGEADSVMPEPLAIQRERVLDVWRQSLSGELQESATIRDMSEFDTQNNVPITESNLMISLLSNEQITDQDNESTSMSEVTFMKISNGLEQIENSVLREEGYQIVSEMHTLTQEITMAPEMLKREIEVAFDAMTVPAELQFILDSEKSPSLQEIIENFAVIDVEELPETVIAQYRQLLQKITELQDQSQKFLSIFNVGYDIQTHEITINPKHVKDPMRERDSPGWLKSFVDVDDKANKVAISSLLGMLCIAPPSSYREEYDLAA